MSIFTERRPGIKIAKYKKLQCAYCFAGVSRKNISPTLHSAARCVKSLLKGPSIQIKPPQSSQQESPKAKYEKTFMHPRKTFLRPLKLAPKNAVNMYPQAKIRNKPNLCLPIYLTQLIKIVLPKS